MKKTSTYARKRQANGRHEYNSAAWLNTIQRCTGYSTESLPGSWLPVTQDAADAALARVKAAFASMRAGQTPASNEEHLDLIAHALGVACIRAGQIAGEKPEDNIMLPPLISANSAMRKVLTRFKRFKKWEMLPPEIEAVDWALEIYETILLASSPAQMTEAADMRMRVFMNEKGAME